jgi:ketosteroid isomerase-like protein
MNKTFWRVALLAGLLGSHLLACASAPAAGSERVALEAAIHRWNAAVKAQDGATLTSMMTEDVELLDDSETVAGREAAVKALREVATRGQLVATTREITTANDVAWHVVGFSLTQKNGDVHALGQALEIWTRVKGDWKLHRRMSARLASPEISLTRPLTKEPVLDKAGK